jgi:trypsin
MDLTSMFHLRLHSNTATGEFPAFVWGDGCGASLVWQDVVLTAAHCVGAFNKQVLVGPTGLYQETGGAQWRKILSPLVIHPAYDAHKNSNDYMMFQIEPSSAKPVEINFDSATPSNNEDLVVVGFGLTAVNANDLSKTQRKVTVQSVPQAQCFADYGGGIIEKTMLCAGVPQGGKDACQGDSGGPLFQASTGKLVGVTSFGDGCGSPGKPGVYARTSGAEGWIKQEICNLASTKPGWCSSVNGLSATLTIKYDKFPEEFAWTLVDSVTGESVAAQGSGSVTSPFLLYVKTVSLIKGHRYTLTMSDANGDGMCCSNGNGYVEVESNGASLLNNWLAFGNSYQTDFTP